MTLAPNVASECCALQINPAKTFCAGMEVAMHATGRYPDWWKGKRFDRPTVGWACSVSGEVARDTVQRILLGRSGAIGSGCIPKDAILETVTARGIADLVGTIKIQHVSGGVSLIILKSYLAGREAFQGETLDWGWCDEEPPIDIYTEILTRTNVGNGPVWLTETPLLGVSEVVRRFELKVSTCFPNMRSLRMAAYRSRPD
jgi:phage terminase large subunit-like protein